MAATLEPDVGEKLVRLPRSGPASVRGLDVEVIPAPLRVLATTWLYLPSDGVLFSSDSFGNAKLTSPDGPDVVTEPLDEAGIAEVELHLGAKYGWLRESDAQTVLEQTQSVFDERSVRMLAPTHGKVIRGSDAVASYVGGLHGLFNQSATVGGE